MNAKQFKAQMGVLLGKFPFKDDQEPAQKPFTDRLWAKVNDWRDKLERGFVEAIEELVETSYGRPSVEHILRLSRTRAGYGGEVAEPSDAFEREDRVLTLMSTIADLFVQENKIPTLNEIRWWVIQKNHHLIHEAFTRIFRDHVCSECLHTGALLLNNMPHSHWFWMCIKCKHQYTRPDREWSHCIEIEEGEVVDRPHPKFRDLIDLHKEVPF